MGTPDSFSSLYQTPSLLRLLEGPQFDLPASIQSEVRQLKDRLQTILLGDYQEMETALQALLPKVWSLRMRALTFLAKIDVQQAIHDLSVHFLALQKQHPELSGPLNKLSFGLELMSKFISVLPTADSDPFETIVQNTALEVPDFAALVNALQAVGADDGGRMLKIVRASLMVELLFFALDLAAERQLPLETGVLHELNYQSAVTVEAYAHALFDMQPEDMPWYQAPLNELQRLLYTAPVGDSEQLRFLEEKRAHFNAWK